MKKFKHQPKTNDTRKWLIGQDTNNLHRWLPRTYKLRCKTCYTITTNLLPTYRLATLRLVTPQKRGRGRFGSHTWNCVKQLVTWSKHSPATYHTFFLATMQNACTTLYTQYCKRSVASSNKQSKSHREAVNTYTANAVNWI